jgi:hypothetical protein
MQNAVIQALSLLTPSDLAKDLQLSGDGRVRGGLFLRTVQGAMAGEMRRLEPDSHQAAEEARRETGQRRAACRTWEALTEQQRQTLRQLMQQDIFHHDREAVDEVVMVIETG